MYFIYLEDPNGKKNRMGGSAAPPAQLMRRIFGLSGLRPFFWPLVFLGICIYIIIYNMYIFIYLVYTI